MSIHPKPYCSFDDCLAAKRECIDEKHAYIAGQAFPMIAATFCHKPIVANLSGELRQHLKSRPCIVQVGDRRLRNETTDVCTYLDVVVLCPELSFHDGRKDILTDATLVAEVLSPLQRRLRPRRNVRHLPRRA